MKETRTVVPGRNNMRFNIAKLKTGNYIVVINDGKEKWTEKLIKLETIKSFTRWPTISRQVVN